MASARLRYLARGRIGRRFELVKVTVMTATERIARSVRRFLFVALIVLCAAPIGAMGCKQNHVVGDHVLVEWEGSEYPAVIISIEGPARYRVHFDGYDPIWDENVNVTRIKSHIKGPMIAPPPPAKVLKRGGAPASSAMGDTAMPSRYKVGTRVRVEWHGMVYGATIVELRGVELYRIHYEGFGSEWDETVDGSRIVGTR